MEIKQLTEEQLNELENKMKNLKNSLNISLEFDGFAGFYDPRLHLPYFSSETTKLNKRQYKRFESILNRTQINKSLYHIYFWCDISGYEYWNKDNREDNYIQGTIYIKNIEKLLKSKFFQKKLLNDIVKISGELDYKLSKIGLYYEIQ